jgi:hypothetical protein
MAAADSAKAKARLPVTASLSTKDPTVIREQASIRVFKSGKKTVSSLRVTLALGKKTYARGARPGTAASGRIRVPLRFSGFMPRGRYTITMTGKVDGTTASRSQRIWLKSPKLPLRAIPLSHLTGDNVGGIRLILRSQVSGRVTAVQAKLLKIGRAHV